MLPDRGSLVDSGVQLRRSVSRVQSHLLESFLRLQMFLGVMMTARASGLAPRCLLT